MRGVLSVAIAVLALVLPAKVLAEQPQDWMVGAGKKGTYVNLDFIFGAVQGQLEHRIPLYGGANMFTLRGGAIAALPFGSTQADAELRILNLTLGTSFGYQSIWRNQTFELGQRMDRDERREREAGGEFNRDVFPFWEGRASMGFIFNDYTVFNHQTTYRTTGMTERSFDNLTAVVHDGDYVRCDFQLFFKHKTLGAIAPVFQILNFSLDDNRRTQFNYGLMLVTRAGLVQRDDIFLAQMLLHTGPIAGEGYDNRDVYGAALWRGPITVLFAYRTVIQLWNGEKDFLGQRAEQRELREKRRAEIQALTQPID
jgi:hypothetical protein